MPSVPLITVPINGALWNNHSPGFYVQQRQDRSCTAGRWSWHGIEPDLGWIPAELTADTAPRWQALQLFPWLLFMCLLFHLVVSSYWLRGSFLFSALDHVMEYINKTNDTLCLLGGTVVRRDRFITLLQVCGSKWPFPHPCLLLEPPPSTPALSSSLPYSISSYES